MTYLTTHNDLCRNRFQQWLRKRDPLVINNRTVAIGRYQLAPQYYLEDVALTFTHADVTIQYIIEASNDMFGVDRGRNCRCTMSCSYKGIRYAWNGPSRTVDIAKNLTRFAQLIMKFNGDYMVSY